jgi:hypothetical protein
MSGAPYPRSTHKANPGAVNGLNPGKLVLAHICKGFINEKNKKIDFDLAQNLFHSA